MYSSVNERGDHIVLCCINCILTWGNRTFAKGLRCNPFYVGIHLQERASGLAARVHYGGNSSGHPFNSHLSYFWWAAENAFLLSTTIGYSRGVHSTTIEEWPNERASVQTISLHAVSSSGWSTFKCQQLAIIVS